MRRSRIIGAAIKDKVFELQKKAPLDAFDSNLCFEEIPDYHSATIVKVFKISVITHALEKLYRVF